MKSTVLLLLLFIATSLQASLLQARPAFNPRTTSTNTFELSDFGAVGDGVADDGPALQAALDAIAAAGGGTLFVPAGRYAIYTPVRKNFAGLATSLTIHGVESLTPVAPPDAGGPELTQGLDLVSEFVPRTGSPQTAIVIAGLETLLIHDLTFIGTPDVENDALITLVLDDISDATIRHCEFYGLSSLEPGGAIIRATRSGLTFEKSVVLGSTCSSADYASVIQNLEWKNITISEAIFADYGQRPELFGKMNASPYSWIGIGNAAAVTNESPRREAVFRSVFLDEGGYTGISSLPDLYAIPSAPIDLVYISGLHMNVSNFGTTGHYLYQLNNVLVENSHYGWTSNADSAIYLLSVNQAILDQLECSASANRIRAEPTVGNLTVINSVYAHLDSQAQSTKVITTATPEADPVQYVRQQFVSKLNREPDAAAHFYWANNLLACAADEQCVNRTRMALISYLGGSPSPFFAIRGHVTSDGSSVADAVITLSGSQTVSTITDANGDFHFSKLPTSGSYTVSAAKANHTFVAPTQVFVTPNTDRIVNFASTVNRHSISGRVTDDTGVGLTNVTLALTSAQNSSTTTTDATGAYAFLNLPAGGNYEVRASKTSYAWTPQRQAFSELHADQTADFTGTVVTHVISGRISEQGVGVSGVLVELSGTQIRTTTTNAGGNFSFEVPSEGSYTITPAKQFYAFMPASLSLQSLATSQTCDFAGKQSSIVEFSQEGQNVFEGGGAISLSVVRMGNLAGDAVVSYSANNGSGIQGQDLSAIIGKLHFAPGEISKTFTVFITDDSFVENAEQLTVMLNGAEGAELGTRASTMLTIIDNDTAVGPNPVDEANFFVRQHYRDFLNREPDEAGLAFWANQIIACGTNAECLEDRRINVSAAFFLSIEFQETGFLVHRFYQTAFGHPPGYLHEFLLDSRAISQGIVVNAPGWEQTLAANKSAFANEFVARPAFQSRYPLDLTPTQFVNTLNATAGSPLTAAALDSAIAEFKGSAVSSKIAARAEVIRRIAESDVVSRRETAPAFVLMEYFGYLQRNPSDLPDQNLDGYNFWLAKLNEFAGDFRRAQMVKSFLVAGEYRHRFGL